MKRFTMNASKTLKALIAAALAAMPAFTLSAAAWVMPSLVTAFLQHCCLFKQIGDIANCAKTFPSESYLELERMSWIKRPMTWCGYLKNSMTSLCSLPVARTCLLIVCLVHCCFTTTNSLFRSFFLGNEKGIDHFVKCLAWLDDNGKRQVHLLDLGGSFSNTEDCADAIQKSLKTLNLLGRTIVLEGQTTNGGGGGALDTLGGALKERRLVVVDEDCLVGACCVHCLQYNFNCQIPLLI